MRLLFVDECAQVGARMDFPNNTRLETACTRVPLPAESRRRYEAAGSFFFGISFIRKNDMKKRTQTARSINIIWQWYEQHTGVREGYKERARERT
jgi:hypothetical protein